MQGGCNCGWNELVRTLRSVESPPSSYCHWTLQLTCKRGPTEQSASCHELHTSCENPASPTTRLSRRSTSSSCDIYPRPKSFHYYLRYEAPLRDSCAMAANEEHPVDKNWFEDPDPTDLSPTTMRFIPRKASRDPSFTASFFRPPDFQEQGTYPGVPLCPQVLRSMEQQSGFVSEFVQVELTFENEEKKLSMSRKFVAVKDEWKAKTKELEKQPGYTPVPPPMNQSMPLPVPDHKPRHKKRAKSPWSFFGKRTTTVTTNGSTATTIIERAVPPQTPVPANPRLPSQWRPDPHRGGGRGGARPRKKATNASSPPSRGSNEDEDD